MHDSREIDYFGQRILQIVQPLAAGGDRTEVLTLLAESIANNFAADGCWILHYPSPGVVRMAASACMSHRTNAISSKMIDRQPPSAPNPTLWRMHLLPDYQVMVVETRDRDLVTGCLIVATKGVDWYPETKLVLKIVADYVSTALIEEELRFQAQISALYPKLHHQLTQAIVENQPTNRLFEIAISNMVKELKLKRGLVLTLKTTDLAKPKNRVADPVSEPTDLSLLANSIIAEQSNLGATPTSSEPEAAVVGTESVATPPTPKIVTQVQIVTTIDTRPGDSQPLPPFFLLEDSHFCQTAIANAPNPTILESNRLGTDVDRLIFQDDRLSSIAMIPLMGATIADRSPAAALWGWLVLQHDKSRRWHPVELELLQCQIYQIALARIHKKSLQQARNTVDSRTSQVQILLQIQTKLLADARNQMERLKQANELKDEFINTIGHELRTPLTSMSLAIKMLHQAEIEPARRQQYLEILDDQCQREIKLVNDLLRMQQLASKQLDFRPQSISFNQTISEQATSASNRWTASKSLELSLYLPKVSPQIETDTESFQHIIEELLINAGKFALPKTKVEAWAHTDGGRAIVQIVNLSKPIPSQDLPHLFEKFRRGTGTTKQAISGTGLGLALVKALVEHIQGEITVTSNPVDAEIAKTCFTVIIPTTLELEHH